MIVLDWIPGFLKRRVSIVGIVVLSVFLALAYAFVQKTWTVSVCPECLAMVHQRRVELRLGSASSVVIWQSVEVVPNGFSVFLDKDRLCQHREPRLLCGSGNGLFGEKRYCSLGSVDSRFSLWADQGRSLYSFLMEESARDPQLRQKLRAYALAPADDERIIWGTNLYGRYVDFVKRGCWR